MVVGKPRNGLLKSRPYMAGIPYVDVDYCQYAGWGYKKPTRIWGSPDISDVKGRLCYGLSCPNLLPKKTDDKWHLHAILLSSKHQNLSTEQKFRIPPTLVQDLMGTLQFCPL